MMLRAHLLDYDLDTKLANAIAKLGNHFRGSVRRWRLSDWQYGKDCMLACKSLRLG